MKRTKKHVKRKRKRNTEINYQSWPSSIIAQLKKSRICSNSKRKIKRPRRESRSSRDFVQSKKKKKE